MRRGVYRMPGLTAVGVSTKSTKSTAVTEENEENIGVTCEVPRTLAAEGSSFLDTARALKTEVCLIVILHRNYSPAPVLSPRAGQIHGFKTLYSLSISQPLRCPSTFAAHLTMRGLANVGKPC